VTTLRDEPVRSERLRTAAATTAVIDPNLAVDETTRRDTPRAPWATVLVLTVLMTVAGLAAWEARMRAVGLRAGDLDDSNDDWAIARRALVAQPQDQIAIVGDSRIWFDTDLAVWRQLTGLEPVQLALEGTNGRFVLADLAADERFRGLAVVGLAEMLYFNDIPGLRGAAVAHARQQSYAQRWGTGIHRWLSRYVAFLDQMYTPQYLIRTLDLPNRPGVVSARMMPWKLNETYDRRQTFLWSRVERDAAWQEQTKRTWMGLLRGRLPPLTEEVRQRVIADTVRDVQRIRARGGEVVFVRPPSAGGFLDEERQRVPRERIWDALIAGTGTVGVHWEDYPELRDVEIPEWSHLSRASATVFTRVYVTQLRSRVPWLQSRARVETH
jgi:hypothetical protein